MWCVCAELQGGPGACRVQARGRVEGGAGQRQRGGQPCCVSRLVQQQTPACRTQGLGIPTCPQGADVAGGLARRSVTAAAAAAAGQRPGAARPEERLPAGRPD